MHIDIDIHIDIHIHIQANIDDLGWTFAWILICTLTFRLEENINVNDLEWRFPCTLILEPSNVDGGRGEEEGRAEAYPDDTNSGAETDF